MLLNLLATVLKFTPIGDSVLGVTMRSEKAIVSVPIQVVKCSCHEVEVVSAALDDLSVKHVRNEC